MFSSGVCDYTQLGVGQQAPVSLQTRALLARALAVGGDALLADEPVAALDPYHQLEVMEILRRRADTGRTVIVVLHDLAWLHVCTIDWYCFSLAESWPKDRPTTS